MFQNYNKEALNSLTKFVPILLDDLSNRSGKKQKFNKNAQIYIRLCFLLVEKVFTFGYKLEGIILNQNDLSFDYFKDDEDQEYFVIGYGTTEEVVITYFRILANLLKEEKILDAFFEHLAKGLFLSFIVKQIEKANLTKETTEVIQQQQLIFFIQDYQFFFLNKRVLLYFLEYLENFSPNFCNEQIINGVFETCRFEADVSDVNFIDFIYCISLELEENLKRNFQSYLEEYDPEEYNNNKDNKDDKNDGHPMMFPKES